ncbi:flagellar basal body L-ring protein FlgH [Shewanella sp. A25]|nr:flagellar basal body L-ring protein FlgH [Shewanella shenzhenensis]
MKLFRHTLALVLLALMSACNSTAPEVTAPVETNKPADKEAYNSQQTISYAHGGLYSDSYMFTLFSDKRAYAVGDILTVVLAERTLSSKSAGSSLNKNSSWGVDTPIVGKLNTSDIALDVNAGTSFNGKSSANQQNSLTGYISVRVMEVMPNGALRIKGRKQIRLNNGDEYIELAGIVRPDDIDVTNEVSSQRIADATISYAGNGTLADASEPGWLTTLFTRYLNPF